MAQGRIKVHSDNALRLKGRNVRHGIPSLRPPTLMIDLLFGALMLFAFQMGSPNQKHIVPKDLSLPTSKNEKTETETKLIALIPVQERGSDWVYKTPDGRRLKASGIKKFLSESKARGVLLVPKSASIQAYVDAEEPLRTLGLKIGLAVQKN